MAGKTKADLEREIAQLKEERDKAVEKHKALTVAGKELIARYGTDWCRNGREEVTNKLAPLWADGSGTSGTLKIPFYFEVSGFIPDAWLRQHPTYSWMMATPEFVEAMKQIGSQISPQVTVELARFALDSLGADLAELGLEVQFDDDMEVDFEAD